MRSVQKICNSLFEMSLLAAVFFTPVFFGFFLRTSDVFELNKAAIFKIFVSAGLFFWAAEKSAGLFRGLHHQPLSPLSAGRGELDHIEKVENVNFPSSAKEGTGAEPDKGSLAARGFLPFVLPFFYLAYSAVRAFWPGGDWRTAFYGQYSRWQGLETQIFYFLFFILAFLFISSGENRGRRTRRLLAAVFFSSILASLYGLVQAAGYDPLAWSETSNRITSTFGQPNSLAAFLIMAIPAGVYLLLGEGNFFGERYFLRLRGNDKSGERRDGRTALFSQSLLGFFILFGLLIDLLALFFTFSLSAFAGIMAGGLSAALFYFSADKKARAFLRMGKTALAAAPVLVIIIFSAAYFSSQFFANRVKHSFDFRQGSLASRLNLWEASATAIKEKPFFGYGLDRQSEVLARHYQKDWAVHEFVNVIPDRAHNFFLDQLLVGGLAGLSLYSAVVFFFFSLAWKNLKEGSDNPLILAAVWGIAGYIFYEQLSFANIAAEICLWLYFALIAGGIALTPSFSPERARVRVMARAPFLLIPATFFFAYLAFAEINAEFKKIFADHFFYEVKKAHFNKDYYRGFEIFSYIEDLKIYDAPYAKQYAALLAGMLDENDYPIYRRPAEKILERIGAGLSENSLSGRFARAEIARTLAKKAGDENFQTAERIFKELIGEAPEMPRYHFFLGRLYLKAGKLAEAEASGRQSLASLPDLSDPRQNDDHKKSTRQFEALARRDLGDLRAKQKRYGEAVDFYKLSLAGSPSDYSLYARLAEAENKKGDFQRAIWYNKRGYHFEPANIRWPLALMRIHRQAGDKTLARFYAEEALKIDPKNEEAKKSIIKGLPQ